MAIRLNKYLSMAGAASRREADRLIVEGKVKVNGLVVTELGTKIDEETDRVAVGGRPVSREKLGVTVLLHKPKGFLTTVKDPLGRRTVMDLLPRLKTRVFPVGRLDADSTGVLLLTNDGELAFRLTHPRYEVKKRYVARVDDVPTDESLAKLRKGVFLEGRRTAPARADVLWKAEGRSILALEIHEGRKREVRKMIEAVGHRVRELKRTHFAGLTAKGLKSGDWRFLTDGETARLRKVTGLEVQESRPKKNDASRKKRN